MIELNENTRLQDLLDRYPWLKDEAIKMNEKARIIENPVVRALVRRSTLKDLCERIGVPMDEATAKIRELMAQHGEA